MQKVCWEGVEAMGRWAMDTLQWGLYKIRRNRDRGWLQHRAQEEEDTLRARERDQ